jgi:hypothetical protein
MRWLQILKRGLPRSRTVTFGSHGARVGWGIAGLLFLVLGFLLARPSLEGAPDPLKPWGLWIGAATRGGVGDLRISSYLDLEIQAGKGCGELAKVEGEMSWASRIYGDPPRWKTELTRLVMAVSGAPLARAEIRYPLARRWIPLELRKTEGSVIMDTEIKPRLQLTEIQFRLLVDISQQAGFGACELTSPAVVEYPGNDRALEHALGTAIGHLAQTNRDRPSARPFVPHNALMWMSVPGLFPDRASLDAEGQVRREEILLSCVSDAPLPAGRDKRDPFYYSRALLTQSSCGSVQTFRDPGAAGALNRHIFLAGILISIGLALLLEAVVTGFTDDRRKRRPGS